MFIELFILLGESISNKFTNEPTMCPGRTQDNTCVEETDEEQETDDNSADTPSSLPGLIDIVSDGSEQSDGSRASKRVVNSYDLCGNE